MISARIRKKFAGARDSAAFSLDVEIQAGSGATVLFGPSGAGKTLTLDCLAGFVRPDDGRIMLDNRILFDAGSGVSLRPQQRQCGYVFQNYALFPNMTLRQNLAFAAERLPRLERHRKVGEMIERFRLEDVAGRKPYEMSGGQKQRCSIARALIGAPSVLLLDEPARGLDSVLRTDLYATLHQVRNDFHVPMILVTHDLDEAFALGSEMFVLDNGSVVQSGAPAEICDRPANLAVAQLLGVYNLLPAEIRMLDPARNVSTLRWKDADLGGCYYPGHLIGDRVHICISPSELHARPRDGKPGVNEVAAQLVRSVVQPSGIRLEFAQGFAADIPRGTYDPNTAEWLVEFPPKMVRIV